MPLVVGRGFTALRLGKPALSNPVALVPACQMQERVLVVPPYFQKVENGMIRGQVIGFYGSSVDLTEEFEVVPPKRLLGSCLCLRV